MAIKHRIKFKETTAQRIAQMQDSGRDSGMYAAMYDFLASPNPKEKIENGKEKKRKKRKNI